LSPQITIHCLISYIKTSAAPPQSGGGTTEKQYPPPLGDIDTSTPKLQQAPLRPAQSGGAALKNDFTSLLPLPMYFKEKNMIKSIVSILISLSLLAAAAVCEGVFANREFNAFREELDSLYDKAEEGTANSEDAKAIRTSWNAKKQRLHVWIPHNDIARVDDILSEAVRDIGEREYSLALAKIEVLINICDTVPGTYSPSLENIL